MSDSQNEKVNLSDKLRQFTETWSPRIVGELNGQHVKLAKLEGEFVWHHHEHEDELFLAGCGRTQSAGKDLRFRGDFCLKAQQNFAPA